MAEPISNVSFSLLSSKRKTELDQFFNDSPTARPSASEAMFKAYVKTLVLQKCCLIVAPQKPSDKDISQLLDPFDAGYIRVVNDETGVNELYYANKKTNMLTQLKLKHKHATFQPFDEEVIAYKKGQALSSAPLEIIRSLTGHVPFITIQKPTSTIFPLNTTALLQTNPSMFKYMSEKSRQVLLEDLTLAFYGLCVRYQTDEIEHRRQHLTPTLLLF